MTPWLVLVVVLMLVGGDGAPQEGKKEKDLDNGDDDGDGDDGGGDGDDGGGDDDEKCPPGAPLVYTGPMFDDSSFSHLNEATENIITPAERATMLYVIGKAAEDDGYPAPAGGTCLLEDLQAYLKLPPTWPNLGLRGWPAALAMLAWSRANLPLSPPRKWDTLTALELKVVERMATYIKAREDNENAENDPGEPTTTTSPTKGAQYIVQAGDNLLWMSGKASGYAAGTVGRREYAKAVTLHPRNAGLRIAAKKGSFDDKYLGGYTLSLHAGDRVYFP